MSADGIVQHMHRAAGVKFYLIPIRFHVYDAFPDLVALSDAPNMPQAPSFASRKRVWRHALKGEVAELRCGMMRLGWGWNKASEQRVGQQLARTPRSTWLSSSSHLGDTTTTCTFDSQITVDSI
jgi:hypothetical protein